MKSIVLIILTLLVPLCALQAQQGESQAYEKADITVTTHTVTTYTEYNIIQKTTITMVTSCIGTGTEACTPGTETVTTTQIFPKFKD